MLDQNLVDKINKDRYERWLNSDLGCHPSSTQRDKYTVHNFDTNQDHEVYYKKGKDNYWCDCYDYNCRCKDAGAKCKHIIAVENYVNNPIILDDNDILLMILGKLAF